MSLTTYEHRTISISLCTCEKFQLTFDADLTLQKVTFTLTQFQSVPQKVFNVHTATELSCNALTLKWTRNRARSVYNPCHLVDTSSSWMLEVEGGRRREGPASGENLSVMSRVVTSGDNKARTGSVLQLKWRNESKNPEMEKFSNLIKDI